MNVLVAVVALAAIYLHTTEAHEIEHKLVWAIPAGGAGEYAAWSAAHSFEINVDSIAFDFSSGEQDLASVTKEDFDSCTTTHPIWRTTGPANVGIVQPGTYYFICTFAGHCAKGQKIATNWTNDSSAAAPAPCPSSTVPTYSALPLKFHSKRVNKHGNKKKVSLTLEGAI